MSVAGKLFYRAWHRPFSLVRACLREGGPLEQIRTEAGRRQMKAAASVLPAPPNNAGTPVELHLLTGRRFWYQTAFCLWSFARSAQRPLLPVIYDDGTLTEATRAPLQYLFPRTRFVSRDECLARLDVHLPAPRYPHLRERWLNYPNIRKLIDPHLGRNGWKLVLDSDLLFFRRPDFLLRWLEDTDRPLHAVDVETAYGYPTALMTELCGARIAGLVNVGLAGLASESLDWDRIESWTAALIGRHGTHYFLEQALVAMLVAGRTCAVAPQDDYVTCPREPEAMDCQAVMHHYVADSKKWYFRHNWKRALGGAALPTG